MLSIMWSAFSLIYYVSAVIFAAYFMTDAEQNGDFLPLLLAGLILVFPLICLLGIKITERKNMKFLATSFCFLPIILGFGGLLFIFRNH